MKRRPHLHGRPRSLPLLLAALYELAASGACAQEAPTRRTGDEAAPDVPWPTQGWTRSTPEAEGLDPAPLRALDGRIRAGEFGNVDRLVVVGNGRLVLDERYPRDYRAIAAAHWADQGEVADTVSRSFNYQHPDHHPYYGGRDVHTLQSVTKSVTSALVGIAIARGELEGVDAPMLGFFPDYEDLNPDPRLAEVTVEDLLTMRSGIEWHEHDRPIGPENTTIQLEESDDWFAFTLGQPMDAEPGTKWTYNSGGSHLLSGVVRQATGRLADAYAEEHLFGPLGIEDYHWKKTPRGVPDTEGGLYLEALDLAKIGYLYLRDGVWDGRRLLPEGWVEISTARIVDDVAPENPEWNAGYGYQWWRIDRGDLEIWAGLGYGDQFLLVLPARGIVAVSSAWNVFGPQGSVLRSLVEALDGAVGE